MVDKTNNLNNLGTDGMNLLPNIAEKEDGPKCGPLWWLDVSSQHERLYRSESKLGHIWLPIVIYSVISPGISVQLTIVSSSDLIGGLLKVSAHIIIYYFSERPL